MNKLALREILFGFTVFVLLCRPGHAEAPDLSTWTTTGSVTLDPSRPGPDGKPSIKVAPGSKASLKLRPGDGSGSLTLYAYDDGTVAATDQKKSVGPRWGFTQNNGRVLVGGIVYAHFFKPNGSLGIIETDATQKDAWSGPKFAGPRDRTGWVKWEFNYDANTGLQIKIDGQPVLQKYFDWATTPADGFDGIVLYGDATNGAAPQTVWIGGIDYELGPPMKANVATTGVAASSTRTLPSTSSTMPYPGITAPPPPPDTEGSSTPASLAAAPVPYSPGATLSDDLKTTNIVPAAGYLAHHPRLLFSASDRAALQQKAKDNPAQWKAVLDSTRELAAVPNAQLITTGAKYWKIHSVESGALAWFVTGDTKYRDLTVPWMIAHCQQPVWGTGFNDNLDLQASWYLYYLSISYDILYSQLNDADRKTIRDGLAAHAKAIYDSFSPDGLHKGIIPYDQNHTYTPVVALTAAALALYGNVPEATDWLNRAHSIMQRSRYVLNEDGYYYEGFGYWQYALHWHARYAELMARATGERLYDLPALRDNWLFALHLSLPGAPGGFDIGDTDYWKGGKRSTDIAANNTSMLWNIAQANQSGESRTAADLYGQRRLDIDDPASAFLWSQPSVAAASFDAIKPYHYFPDVDVVTWRSSWQPDATCYLFRCGPPLGHSAEAKLDQIKDWEMNTGHGHADIGAFYLYGKGAYLAGGTGYTAEKWTRDQNTLLVDGKGQASDGEYHNARGIPYGDLNQCQIDAQYLDKDYGFASGEFGAAYTHSVPGVNLRRKLLMTARWMLDIDTMSSSAPHAITWLCHCDAAFAAEDSGFVACLPNAALGVIPLSKDAFSPAMGPATVMAGNKPGAGKAEQHGFQITLTQTTPATAAEAINLLVPLNKDGKLPSVQLTSSTADAVAFTLKWPDGKTEDVKLDLNWKSGGASGPATITRS
jgi:hypothetical protein